MKPVSILISYARADGAKASARLRTELMQADYDVWRDVEDMRGGEDWKAQLREAIRAVDVVVVLFTPSAVVSKYVLWECETAETLDKKIIGLLIKPCNIPDDLSRLHYHDLTTASKYTTGFAKLIRDLNELATNKNSVVQNQPTQPTPSKYNIHADKMKYVQIGDGNTQINTTSAKQNDDVLLAKLTQHFGQLIKAENQQLQLMILTELSAIEAEHREQIDSILQQYQHGSINTHDLSAFMADIQALLVALNQETNSQLAHMGNQLEEIFDSHLSQEHKFELTLPIIPGIFNYHYNFGGGANMNLKNLINKIRQTWNNWST